MRAGLISEWSSEEMRAVRLALTRQQQRREQGIPTLGVLVGAAAEAEGAWRGWAQAAGWRVVVREWGEVRELGEGETGEAVLYVCRGLGGSGLASAVERLGRTLNARGADQPGRPLALAVEAGEADAFLRDEPFHRARTLFAEGVVRLPTGLPAPTAPTGTPGVRGEGDRAEGGGGGSASASAGTAWRAETVASFDAARAALGGVAAAPGNADQDDRARSAAERFLFDLLNDLPETRGAFELNVRLGFCFGPGRAEVDLLAAGLRLAVEIDGFYHFRDPDGYRRDRRKDALLQRQGYLVLRFLAEDVVVRLEEIVEEILTTVAFRRATGG